MALELDRIKAAFYRFSGEDPADSDAERTALCESLCEEALAKAETMMAVGDKSNEVAAVESWCAAEAFYQLTLIDEALTPDSFSADGVTLGLSGRSEKARALRDEKRAAADCLLGEGAFYFGRA